MSEVKFYTIDKIRNIGIIAHIDAGKTTTTERLLYYTNRIYRMGNVDDGNTTMDWMEQERERGITITSAATYCTWRDCQINIIDTPGHVDFTVEVERSLRVLDGCIVIFDAVNGVEPQSETVWRQADKYNVPRVVFINKMDRPGADFNSVVNEFSKYFSATPLILQIPFFIGSKFSGAIDIIKEKLLIWKETEEKVNFTIHPVPEEFIDKVKEYREQLIEKLAEGDDEFMKHFLGEEKIEDFKIKEIIRKLTLTSKFFPVICGSALKNIGIQPILDCVVDYLPSPDDLKPVIGENPFNKKTEVRNHNVEDPFSAIVFKIQTDPYVGKLNFVRVYSGNLKVGQTVYNVRKNKKERVIKIVRIHANYREDVEEARAGDIVGLVGLKNVSTGDTLADIKHPVVFESMHFPEPVIWVAVEPKTKNDQEKVSYALKCMTEEDPTFKVKIDNETNQTIISGMGELHLDIIVDRIKREFNVELNVGRPHVAYRETITNKVIEETKYIKQTGGKGQYAHVVIEVAPAEKYEFIDKTKGGIIPKEFIPAIENGIREAMETGPIAGYPVINVKVTLLDGSYHEVDSSELAFELAAEMSFKNAVRKASPVLMEPIMKIEIVTPEEYLGDVMADFTARRGKITRSEKKESLHYIYGVVPLGEMFGYATVLRSLSKGRANYIMELSHYATAPKNIVEMLVPQIV